MSRRKFLAAAAATGALAGCTGGDGGDGSGGGDGGDGGDGGSTPTETRQGTTTGGGSMETVTMA